MLCFRALVLTLVGCVALPAAAQSPIEIGKAYDIASRALGEHRTVNVVLPPSYAKTPERRYPVLYLIDGGIDQDLLHVAGVVQLGAMWGRSAEAIVVGIETKDRRKELVGPTKDPDLLKRFPTAGSSSKFREFLKTEVKPLVERTYRTGERSAVLGESLAGLFVIETYLTDPELFDAYGAIDPSLWWDKEALSRTAIGRVNARHKGRSLFLAIAKEQLEEPSASQRLISAIRNQGLPNCELRRSDLTHATIYQQLTPQAAQYLLPPSKPPALAFGFNLACTNK
jgi:hypothetical protein